MLYALILAGGTGSRAGTSVPKQFHDIAGRPLLWWSLSAFREAVPDMVPVVVVHPGWMEWWQSRHDSMPQAERIPHMVVPGGCDRTSSVANGLAALPAPEPGDLVAVHDGARGCVTPGMILRGVECARIHGAAVPGIPVTDSLRMTGGGYPGDPTDSRAVDRSAYVAVQTPQVFDAALLNDCFGRRAEGVAYTDDASVVEPHHPVALYPGEPSNIKVTHPDDFAVAERVLAARLCMGRQYGAGDV